MPASEFSAAPRLCACLCFMQMPARHSRCSKMITTFTRKQQALQTLAGLRIARKRAHRCDRADFVLISSFIGPCQDIRADTP